MYRINVQFSYFKNNPTPKTMPQYAQPESNLADHGRSSFDATLGFNLIQYLKKIDWNYNLLGDSRPGILFLKIQGFMTKSLTEISVC